MKSYKNILNLFFCLTLLPCASAYAKNREPKKNRAKAPTTMVKKNHQEQTPPLTAKYPRNEARAARA